MKHLMQIRQIIQADEEKIISYSLILALWFVLIIAAILILRLDKLKVILKFIILFFKEKSSKDDVNSL